MAKLNQETGLSWYAAREPLVLLLLSAMAVAFFFAVTGLSKAYASQRKAQGNFWFMRGVTDLNSGGVQKAVNDFHVALGYSRGNFTYQIKLAEALMALNRTDEANTYMLNLWQQEPENGTVNLDLARIYAAKGDVTQAIRYYHNAVYAIWSVNPEAKRRTARLELIDFLFEHNQPSQAKAELIALTGNLPADSSLHARAGDLFMQVPDYDRALTEYRQSLKLDPKNVVAHTGKEHAESESKSQSAPQEEVN